MENGIYSIGLFGGFDFGVILTGCWFCVFPERMDEPAGYADARRIEQAVENNLLLVESVEPSEFFERLSSNPNISRADIAVLALARSNGIAIMDDSYGRGVAATEDIPTRGTAFLILSVVQDGHVSSERAREITDAIIDEGWYCSTDVYTRIVRRLEAVG